MSRNRLLTAAILIGLIMGVACSKFVLVSSPLSLIPWGIVGLIIGWLALSMRWAMVCGAAYGFVLAFSFMLAGYSGSESTASRILPFAALGLVGAFCGFVSAVVANGTKKLTTKAETYSEPPSKAE